MVRAMRGLLVLLVPLLGCATATPRFSQELATAFAQDDMRRLETPELEVYYPAAHREAAERVARRAAQCLNRFRLKQPGTERRARALLFLTSANFNNAYVTGQFLGEPLHSVNPLQTSLELLHWYGLPGADAADVSCHEMFHYAHFEQVGGVWRILNTIVGEATSPQLFLERWFTEGAAQFYEGRVERKVGRPHSPIYRGAFEAFVDAREGALGPGDLNSGQRELQPFSGAYFTSLPFVEWLVAEFGEEALWQLMDRQGRLVVAPIGVSLRFNDVYGKTLGALIDDWSAHLARTRARRTRPPTQRVLRPQLGQLARLAVHGPSGTIALVQAGNDEVPMLRILERDGTERVAERLIQLRFGREWVLAGPLTMSGLTFSADGKHLYLMNEDLISRGDTRTQLWRIDATTGHVLRVWQEVGRGQGGALTADERGWVFVSLEPGRSGLARFDLETSTTTLLHQAAPGVALAAPALFPDGRIVFSQLDGAGWNLWLREPDGAVRALTSDGAFNYGAKWVDGERVTFTRTHEGRLQVHRLEVSTGRLERLTDAPWALLDAWPSNDRVLFVNRDGTQWSLDEAPAVGLASTDGGPAADEWAAGALAADAGPEEGPRVEGNAPPVAGDAGSPMPAPLPEPPALKITGDEAYSGLDHLFVPQLRLPGITALPLFDETGAFTGVSTTLSASLSGKDRLGRHGWAINGAFTFPSRIWSVSLEYVNLQLAPWELGLSASRDGVFDGAFWSAAVTGGRSFFTVPVSFGVRALVSETIAQPLAPAFIEKYFGPEASISYSAVESTAYGGPQRQLSLSAQARAYPQVFGSDRNLFDLRGSLALAVPLPFTRRHSLVATVVGRGLPGSPQGALRVGGQALGATVFQSLSDLDVPRGPGGFLPGSLAEAVRGYDDFTLRTEGVGIANARYRFNVIIDRGTASILFLGPSFFLRQIDLEAFGTGALTVQGQWLRAAGGAASLRVTLMDVLPVSLTYQYAWRFDFDRGGLHTVFLSVE